MSRFRLLFVLPVWVLLLALLSAAVHDSMLQETTTIRVIVAAEGKPLSGATVILGSRRGISDASGTVFLENVVIGRQALRVSAPGYRELSRSEDVGLLSDVIRITLSRAILQGTAMIVSPDGGAEVRVDGRRAGVIGDSGKLFVNLDNGSHQVVIRREGFREQSKMVTIEPDLTTPVEFPALTRIPVSAPPEQSRPEPESRDEPTREEQEGGDRDVRSPERTQPRQTYEDSPQQEDTSPAQRNVIPQRAEDNQLLTLSLFALLLVMVAFTGGLGWMLYNRRRPDHTAPRLSPVHRHGMSDGRFDEYFHEEIIGRGGMATLYRCRDRAGVQVAVKIMDAALVKDQDLVTKFLREGEYVRRIREADPSTNVADIFKIGREGGRPDGLPFIAMELLRGQDLFRLLKENPTGIPVAQVRAVGAAVAHTLSVAHRLKITHRDVTPDNIIMVKQMTDKFRYVLIDFGIARHEFTQHKTLDGSIAGKPPYMSPEQCSNEAVDHRTDIYSLGVVLYALLTGKPPFYGANPIAVMRDHLDKPVPPLPEGSPAPLVSLIMAMLEKKKEQRLQSMEEVVRILTEAR